MMTTIFGGFGSGPSFVAMPKEKVWSKNVVERRTERSFMRG
jgi:hypothetical protein